MGFIDVRGDSFMGNCVTSNKRTASWMSVCPGCLGPTRSDPSLARKQSSCLAVDPARVLDYLYLDISLQHNRYLRTDLFTLGKAQPIDTCKVECLILRTTLGFLNYHLQEEMGTCLRKMENN